MLGTLIKLIAIGCLTTFVKSELFTAVSDGEDFLHNELYTINVLDGMVASEQKRIEEMKRAVDHYRSTVKNGLKVGLNNPVYFYGVIKNLSTTWKQITNLSNGRNAEVLKNITSWRAINSAEMPTEDDVKQSRIGLLRLQETYELIPVDIASGKIAGVADVGASLDAEDCYEMGLLYAGQKDYYNTLLWMDESLKRFNGRNKKEYSKIKIDAMEHFAFALYKQGNVERALQLTFDLLEFEPKNQRFKNNVQFYEKILSQTGYKYDANGNPPPLKNVRAIKNDRFSYSYDIFKKLCQGKYSPNKQNKSKLKCYYKTDKYYLRLAPLKVEVVNLYPEILLFRQVLSDTEIDIIEKLTKPKMIRALVHGSGQCSHTPSRVAQSGWLKNDEHVIIPDINKRLNDMTNLDMSTAELLQIVNYGIGGHYHVHFDASRQTARRRQLLNGNVSLSSPKNEIFKPNIIKKDVPKDDRIATVLFYMSTPLAGGATIFPELNLTLYPSKNDAIFWHNILRSGEPDMRTSHAGCPVLSGLKWVANKWIHERGQEFHRPCSLNRYEEN